MASGSDDVKATFTKLSEMDPKLLTLDKDKLGEQLQKLQPALSAVRQAGQIGLQLTEQRNRLADELKKASAEVARLTDRNKDLERGLKELSSDASASDQVVALSGKLRALEERVAELTAENKKLASQGGAGVAQAKLSLSRRQQDEFVKLQRENAYLSSAVRTLRTDSSAGLSGSKARAAVNKNWAKSKIGSLTLKRNFMRAEEDRIIVEEVREWVAKLLDTDIKNLVEEAQSGVLLCDLIEKIDPHVAAVIGRVHRNAKSGSFYAHDNVQAFLRGCSKLGVPRHQLFSTSDLIGKVDPRKVGYCLLALAKAATAYGIEPPPLVAMEIEIDQQRASAKPMKVEVTAKSATQAATELLKESSKPGTYTAVKDDPVDVLVGQIVQDLHMEHPPQRLRAGEYKFGRNQVVYVRMHKDKALVRTNDSWQELNGFMVERAREYVLDKAQLSTIEEQKNDKSAAAASAVGASGGDTDDTGKKKRGYDVGAYKEFFYLTALACKLNHSLKEEDVCVVRTEDLYNLALDADVPFHQFASWIDNELTKAYLKAMETGTASGASSSLAAPGNLRMKRRATMDALKARPHNRRFHQVNPQEVDETEYEDEEEQTWLGMLGLSGWL